MCEECPLSLNAFLSTRPPKGLKNIRYFCSIWGHFSRGGSEGVPPTHPDRYLPSLLLWTFQRELLKCTYTYNLEPKGVLVRKECPLGLSALVYNFSYTFRDMNYFLVTFGKVHTPDRQTESDAYQPTVQFPQVG